MLSFWKNREFLDLYTFLEEILIASFTGVRSGNGNGGWGDVSAGGDGESSLSRFRHSATVRLRAPLFHSWSSPQGSSLSLSLTLFWNLCAHGFLWILYWLLNLKEPELLRVDAERIQRQMQEVAVGNYRAFITAADALLAIRQEVSSIDKHLESLVNYIFTFNL